MFPPPFYWQLARHVAGQRLQLNALFIVAATTLFNGF